MQRRQLLTLVLAVWSTRDRVPTVSPANVEHRDGHNAAGTMDSQWETTAWSQPREGEALLLLPRL